MRRIREVLAIPDILFQFTHPGKGATASASAKFFSTWVSIHAPWEGCDLLVADKSNTFFRFNSRTLGRVRRSAPYQILLSVRFQFTHPGKGATMRHCNVIGCALFQFTHPGKGATRVVSGGHRGHSCFNSRTLGRVRPTPRCSVTALVWFQFTHPGKGATSAFDYPSTGIWFNSRTLGRVRLPCGGYLARPRGFNSRTLGRVRHRFNPFRLLAYQFQFTHPGKGATHLWGYVQLRTICFNSRTLGRVRQYLHDFYPYVLSFNSRTLGRVRREDIFISKIRGQFQFTHPGKGATVWCKVAYYRADKQA